MALFRATPVRVIWETKPAQPSVGEAILEVQFNNGDHQYLTVQVLRVSERIPPAAASLMYTDPEESAPKEEKKPAPTPTINPPTKFPPTRPPGYRG